MTRTLSVDSAVKQRIHKRMKKERKQHHHSEREHRYVRCKHCEGSGWLEDGWNWVKNNAKTAIKAGLRTFGGPVGSAAALGMDAIGLGAPRRKRLIRPELLERNQIVRQVMQEYNMKLPDASRYVKENNLWTP